jgi:exonuclease III
MVMMNHHVFAMNNQNWNILCWNIRGINVTPKWDAIHDKIEESACSIICLQETKKEHFDMSFIHNFAPKRFDRYDLVPSVGGV